MVGLVAVGGSCRLDYLVIGASSTVSAARAICVAQLSNLVLARGAVPMRIQNDLERVVEVDRTERLQGQADLIDMPRLSFRILSLR